ncbi:DUF2313 domain-containing protein [Lactobacillus sp. ESL0731]|uniref:putative phage tail protein n=1 Tax=unclassified Lactobacillus TaxID=2620435 RepID=UPI0023F89F6B|nr:MULTISPECIES: putative phage tail protein [unclassified Lactobacillus]WEV51683.1 DUF2313 domain-containing protein [Lactobacillus sp. ESL0700]WEV62812.1 DUF2313 domain-containing protein [Lactobacillus sp. ESL0731]
MSNNLMNYLPDYYQDVYEMQAIMHAHGQVLDEFESKQIRTLLNQFVTQTDSRGIAVFENQVGVQPSPGDDLVTRQNRVLMHLLPPRPITIRYLRELFKTLKIPINITIDRQNVIVEGTSSSINNTQIDDIRYILNVYLPANMLYEIKIALKQALIGTDLFIGIGMKSKVTTVIDANVSQIF